MLQVLFSAAIGIYLFVFIVPAALILLKNKTVGWLLLYMVLFYISAIFLGFNTNFYLPTYTLGLLLFIAGAFLHVYSVFILSKAIKEKKLATSRVYSIVRHPIYLSGGLAMIGTAIALSSSLLAVLLAFILPFVAYKIMDEEKELAKIFKTKFLKYKKRTPMIFPFAK